MRRLHAPSLLAAFALLLRPGVARAESPGTQGSAHDATTLRGAAPLYWELGRNRLFVSSTIDAGLLYLRPQLAFGYGKPHAFWAGIEAFPAISAGNTTEYLGLRAMLRFVNIRAGARYVFTPDRRFLTPRYRYSRDQIEPRFESHSRYVALDGEVSLDLPLPYGSILATVTGHALFNVPRGMYVFEEGLRVVVNPPFVGRARLGYALRFGPGGDVMVGAFGELITIPGRSELVARVGPLAALRISDHLDLIGSVAIVVGTRDALGLTGSDVGQFGIRYTWASGEPVPVSLIP